MRRLLTKILLEFIIILAVSPLILSQAVFAEQNVSISIDDSAIAISTLPGLLSSASKTFTVSTSNLNGYVVNLSAGGATNSLINVEDSSYTIPTFTFPEGVSSLPASSLGFGYGFSVDGGNNYSPIPTQSAPVQIFETFAAGTNQHTLTIGAKVDLDTAAGVYTNTITLAAIAKPDLCASDSICYYGNGDDGTGTMEDQSASSNTNVTLIPSNFSRPGYGFAGWNTAPNGSGTTYGPSETITTGDISTTGLQLFAKWIPSSGNLQSFHGCTAMSNGDIVALTDTRDNNTYAIAKQADGLCWMMESLRLDLSNQNLAIDDLNTNNPTASFANSINTNHPASTNDFCEATNPNAACVNQILSNTNNINRNLTASYTTNNNSSSWYSYGVYYNWYTATAGHGTYSVSTAGAIVEGDICPAGWRLPTGYGINGDYAKLDIALGGNGKNQTTEASSARWRAYPLNFIYSGEQRGSTGYNRDTSGSYATANANSAQRSLNFWLQKTAINLNSNSNLKPRGQTIRCVINSSYLASGNIHYDSNGGTGTMADDVNVIFRTATAANNEFTKDKAEFMYWNTRSDGTGTTVLEGGSVANAANDMGIVDGGTLTLYAIWQSAYNIVYAGNGADTGTMSDSLHGNIDHLTEINLIAPNFSRSGYGFAGWSTDASAATKLINHQNVKIYGPNEKVTLDDNFYANADANNVITFYAVWLPADSTYTMQNFGNSQCSALQVGTVFALTDTRDNNTYAVAKLADNHCWMIENLRLIPSAVTFSDSNTNLPTSAFITAAANSSTSNTLCGTNDSACVDTVAYNTNNINSGLTPRYDSNAITSMWYSYGVMYNWYTATAGNGNFNMSSGSTTGDICPAGWRLPTSGNNGEFSALNTAVNSGRTNTDVGLRNYPNNLIYSGDFNKTTFGGRSTYGRLWSATAANANNAYRLGFTSSEVTPVKSYNKWDAFAIRCIVK